MANNRRKSAAIALAIVGIAGLSLASASQLIVDSKVLQAGTDVVGQCDSVGVDVTYTYAFSGGQYVATGGSVNNIDAACAGGTVGVTLLAGAVPTTAVMAGTVPAAGGSVAFTVANVSAKDLSDVSVVIAN